MPKKLPDPHHKPFYKRWWFWTFIVLVLLIGGGAMLGQSAYRNYQKQQLSYLEKTTTLQTRDLKKTITANGTIVPDEQVQLGFSAGTKVKEVNYHVGDTVDKNDIILSSDFQKIKAPFDGRVLAINTFVDDVVHPGTPVVTVGFRDTHIEFTASEAELVSLALNQPAMIAVPAVNDGNDTYTATVQFIDVQKQAPSAASAVTGGSTDSGYLVKITDGSLPDELRHTIGLSVDVVITVAEKTSVLSIEPAAIQYNDDGSTYVYLAPTLDDAFYQSAMGATNVISLLSKRNITTGFVGDDYTEVSGGINSQDRMLLFVPKSSGA